MVALQSRAEVKANSPGKPSGYFGGMAGPPYPEDTKAAKLQRWYTGYNIIRLHHQPALVHTDCL